MQSEIYDFSSLDFLHIRIETTKPFVNTFLSVDITEFDPDNVRIPGSCDLFKLQSMILFFPNDPSRCNEGGHYTCVKRGKTSWLHISDRRCEHVVFDKTLKNVYMLFLEKI